MATTLTITIDLDTAVSAVTPDYGVIRVLESIITRIRRGLLDGSTPEAIIGTDVSLRDVNGNTIGALTVYPTDEGR